MDSVYDCARPILLVASIFGLGGNKICEIEGVRSVRNTRFSSLIAVLISLIITPAFLIKYVRDVFSGEQRSLLECTYTIIYFGQYAFILSTTAMTCIWTHIYCKNLTKVLHILNNTDMMLKQENIHVNYWKIALKPILFGLISSNYFDQYASLRRLLWPLGPIRFELVIKLFIDIAYEIYFMWLITFLLIIRERFVGLNKLLLQNAQGPSIMQDDSLLRRISLARDIHEQLSDAIALFSDGSRFIIIGVLVPGMLNSIFNAIGVAGNWNLFILAGQADNVPWQRLLLYLYLVAYPIMKIVVLTAVCEAHKNNRQVLTARLRQLISREEDPRTVHQLQQYIWYIHDTVAGLVDFQYVDVDFTLLFTVIDIIVQYVFVVYSHYRTPVVGETM